jgi:hypothetical protein
MLVPALALFAATALTPTAGAGEVSCPAGLDELDQRVDLALDAYAIMDTDAFFAAHRQAREAVGCLDVLLEPEDVAAYHGVSGLAAFLTENDEATLHAFSAALAADPSWSLPERVAPAGTVLVELQQEAAGLGPGARSPLPNTEGFILMFDGEPSLERPAERPCVLQVVSDDWDVLWSGALGPGDDLPPAALDPERFARGSSALAQALGDESDYDRNTTGRLAYGAAGFGVAAVGLFTASAISKAQRASSQRQCIDDAACVADEDAWTERMDTLHHRALAFGWSGAGCSLAAAGLGVGAVLEWRF